VEIRCFISALRAAADNQGGQCAELRDIVHRFSSLIWPFLSIRLNRASIATSRPTASFTRRGVHHGDHVTIESAGECVRTIDRDQVRVLDKEVSGNHLVKIQWPGTAPEVNEAFTRDLSN
jgi:hypothetical protein